MIFFIYKLIIRIKVSITQIFDYLVTWIKFKGNKVDFSTFVTHGTPYIMMSRKGKRFVIGSGFSMNNGIDNNPIGCPQPCTFFIGNNAEIVIGKNVGISQTALISHCSIIIGDNVKIGGGTCIYTSDFHSLDPKVRMTDRDMDLSMRKPVVISNNVFVGAHSIILKGVTIGENSVVGAGSIVAKDIPENQIWGGNPAKFIRNL